MTTQFERTGNPFPGLRPFDTDEYNLFFGRDGQSDELLARLARTRFLAVVGTSGSGKSSLIRAGLMPALYGGLLAQTGSAWRVAVMRPGNDPIGNLACALSKDDVLGSPEVEDDVQAAIIETTLRRSTLGLVDAVRQARLAAYENVLVVVDQFEELFRFRSMRDNGGTEDDAAAFVKLLLEAPKQRDVSLHVVLTMRSDFLGDCAQFWGLPEAINEGQYLIPRMTRDERRSAITGPARVADAEISRPLVNRLLNDAGDNPDQLPILQHALMRTWDYWSAHRRNGDALGLEDYEAVGAMSDALSLHAEEAFGELPDERSRLIAEKMFKALTERGSDNRDIRRPTRLSEIAEIAGATEEEVTSVVEVFRREGRSFLTPPAEVALTPDSVIDISHESLIRNWQRLKEWVVEEAQSARIYRRLAEAAVLHREGEEGLLQDPGLQIALDWREKASPNAAWGRRYHPEFDAAIAYLEASRAARDAAAAERERKQHEELERERRERAQAEAFAEQQRRAAQRLRRFTFALVLISLFALVAAFASACAFAQAHSNERLAHESEARAQNLAGELKKSLEGETAAKEDANRHRLDAEAAQKKAEDERRNAEGEQKKAEAETKRADAAALLAARHAEEERRAKEGLKTALAKSEAIKEASRFFRNALADFDRAEGHDEEESAYNQVQESVKKFEAVQDWDGVASAYIKMGKVSPMFERDPFGIMALENWERAVGYYIKSGNHGEAGETNESIADARALGAIADAKGGDDDSKPDSNFSLEKIDRAESKVIEIPEAERADIIKRYEAAYAEYEKAQTQSPRSMISVLNKLGMFYDSFGDKPNKLKAIERYTSSLRIQDANPTASGSESLVAARLMRLYYETGQPALAAPFIEKMLAANHAQGWKGEAEALSAIAFDLKENPAAAEFGERARQIYHRNGNSKGEERLLLLLGSEIRDAESSKAQAGRPLSEDNYKRALSYYESALSLAPPKSADPTVLIQPDVWQALAKLQEVTGRKREAAEAYEHAAVAAKGLKSDIYMSELYKKLGPLQIETNRLPQALETYKHYLALLNSTSEELEEGEKEGVLEKIKEISKKLGIPLSPSEMPAQQQQPNTPPR